MQQTHWCSHSLPPCLCLTVETIWQQMCLSLDWVLFNICWCLKEIRPTWKNPNLAPSWKAGLGIWTGQAPMAGGLSPLLLTQLKQPKTLLGYSTHAHWTCSSLQHSWSDGQEAKNMHLGTDILSDAHASFHSENTTMKEGCQLHSWPQTHVCFMFLSW